MDYSEQLKRRATGNPGQDDVNYFVNLFEQERRQKAQRGYEQEAIGYFADGVDMEKVLSFSQKHGISPQQVMKLGSGVASQARAVKVKNVADTLSSQVMTMMKEGTPPNNQQLARMMDSIDVPQDIKMEAFNHVSEFLKQHGKTIVQKAKGATLFNKDAYGNVSKIPGAGPAPDEPKYTKGAPIIREFKGVKRSLVPVYDENMKVIRYEDLGVVPKKEYKPRVTNVSEYIEAKKRVFLDDNPDGKVTSKQLLRWREEGMRLGNKFKGLADLLGLSEEEADPKGVFK